MISRLFHHSILIGILLLATAVLFWQIGATPPGITNDEAGIIYSAYSIAKTGRDVMGNFLPLSFNLDNSFSPVPIYLTVPFVGLLGVSPVTGRLPFALLGVGAVFLVYYIAKTLAKNQTIGYLSAILFAVSPWHIHINRVAYDGDVAQFFFLLGTAIYLKKMVKGSILWALPALMLAFYSYHGLKIFYVGYIPILVVIGWKYLQKRRIELALFVVGAIAIMLSFYAVVVRQHVSRQDVFMWNAQGEKAAASEVNMARQKNTAPFLLRVLFENKIIYFGKRMEQNYLQAFSPEFLFLYGEPSGLENIYGIVDHGVMYLLDLPLLILGMLYLFKTKDKTFGWYLTLAALISPLSSTFTEDRTYVMRLKMFNPILVMICAAGVYYLAVLLSRYSRQVRQGALVGVAALYTLFVGGYLYGYFYRYSVYNAEAWFHSERVVSQYAAEHATQYQHIFIVESSNMFVLQFAIYNQSDPTLVQRIWKGIKPRQIGKVVFLSGCIDTHKKAFDPDQYLPEHSLYMYKFGCYPPSPKVLLSVKDAGEPLRTMWEIYERK